MGKRAAFIISRLFGPLPLLCLLWLMTALKSGIGFWRALWVYPLIFVVTILIPTIITTYLVAIKKVESLEWANIEDRKKYLLPVTAVTVLFLNILTYQLTNFTIFHLALLFSAIIFSLIAVWTIFNFKISGHIVIATVTFAGINLFFGLQFLWLFLLLIPIIWARYTLKIHTLPQLISGFLLPSLLILVALFLFGWPQVS